MAFRFNKELNGVAIRRKDYSSEEAYLGAIFDANKTRILTAYQAQVTPGLGKQQFINNVIATKEITGGTISGALNTVGRSVAFTPEVERFKSNIVTAMKRFGKYQKFRELTKDERGRYTKFNPSLLRYNRQDNSYVYDGRVQIFTDKSPEDIVLQELA